MTVNFFGFEMVQEYFPTEAKPTSITTYTDDVLEAYYKCFTTGFETSHSITDCVQEDDRYRATVSSASFVVSAGSLIKTDTVVRVLSVNKLDGKCELMLDKQIGLGQITVCGLGFIPESVDTSTRSFTVRDRKYNKQMTFRLNFRDNLTDSDIKLNESFVSLTVDGVVRWLIPQVSYFYQQDTHVYNIATYMAFKSFVSNGSFLWFTVKISSVDNFNGITNLGYGYCGWLNENVLLCPSISYTHHSIVAANMDSYDATANWPSSDIGKLCFVGLGLIDVVPCVIKPWTMSTHLGGDNNTWTPSFSTQVKGLGSAYLLVNQYMFKLPGIQYAPIVSYNTPAQLFKYGDKHIMTGEALNASIPRYFSLDERDWEQ